MAALTDAVSPFHALDAATGNERSPSVEWRDDQHVRVGRTETATTVDVGRTTEAVGEVQRSCSMKTAVHQNTQPELDPLRNSQPEC